MKTKGNWVIKTSTGLYWCGANLFDEQLRKAQVYHWKEKAEEQATLICKKNKLSEDVACEVVAVVEPKELSDTEAEWNCFVDKGIYVCSACGRSALNDYRGRSTDSKFCPNCGKRMTNSTVQED